MSGFLTIARAIQTLCCSPPDSSLGNFFEYLDSSVNSKASFTRLDIFFFQYHLYAKEALYFHRLFFALIVYNLGR